ncbi:MAG TPA: helix-turn-helix domain-containing protein [Longimicrobiaceae bacterium]|nr:helix-turn-helix domain-containing protein [Longimicrobiaceae bacterium]
MPQASPYVIVLSDEERKHLEATARRYTAPYAEVVRAKLILLAAEGLENEVIGQKLDLPRQVVSKWRIRFHQHRLEGLCDQPRSGRPAGFPPTARHRGKGDRL